MHEACLHHKGRVTEEVVLVYLFNRNERPLRFLIQISLAAMYRIPRRMSSATPDHVPLGWGGGGGGSHRLALCQLRSNVIQSYK